MMRASIIVTLLIAALCATAMADGEKTFGICFNQTKGGFQELNLPDRIYGKVVGFGDIRIATPARTDAALKEDKRFISDYYEPELMSQLAQAVGVRYIVWLKVEEADARKSAHTYIPYVFRSQHRKYVLGVRMYVIDSFDGSTVESQYFETERKGPAVLNYMDFDANDPGLSQPYTALKGTFAEMEDEIADLIADAMLKVAHNR
jgi:hypothetical protein